MTSPRSCAPPPPKVCTSSSGRVPYVCAEWELGGYPAWLLADPALVLRSTDEKFTRPAARWLARLGRELAPLLSNRRRSPIIAVQLENEYGSFDKDKAYLEWHRRALLDAGFGGALVYTADGDVQLPNGTLDGMPAVVNFGVGGAENAFKRLAAFRPGAPLMTGEYWAGWFDHWGRAARHHEFAAGRRASSRGCSSAATRSTSTCSTAGRRAGS